MDSDIIFTLYQRPETVFTVHAIAQLFPNLSYKSLRDRLRYFTKTGKLQRLRHGIYAKISFDPLELVNKLYTPSYISLETVLQKAGVTFQYYERIFAVSYLTREIRVGDITIQYRRIDRSVLTNTEGVIRTPGYFIASPERAFLDAVAIYKNYFFDHLGVLDWNKIRTLKTIYHSSALEKRVRSYNAMNKEDYGHD